MTPNDNAAGSYVNTATHPVDLDDGRVLAPGESADIDKQRLSTREKALVEGGQLTARESSYDEPIAASPEPEAEPEAEPQPGSVGPGASTKAKAKGDN
jgi:hypothetical protein